MKNILLIISYDGTDFCGWQRQDCAGKKNTRRTVQGELEIALEKFFKTPITLYGSGRTDSGVHAVGQAANFFSPIESIPEKNYVRALNVFLPSDIRILQSYEVPENFNARFSATSRVYRYFMNFTDSVNAVQNRFSWSINYSPNIKNLNEMVALLQGEMDCASFSSSVEDGISTNRYIEKAHFFLQDYFLGGTQLVFEIEANAFLWKMVRAITGTLISLDKSGKTKNDFQKIIESRNRNAAPFTAPSKGLFLYKVNFEGVRRH